MSTDAFEPTSNRVGSSYTHVNVNQCSSIYLVSFCTVYGTHHQYWVHIAQIQAKCGTGLYWCWIIISDKAFISLIKTSVTYFGVIDGVSEVKIRLMAFPNDVFACCFGSSSDTNSTIWRKKNQSKSKFMSSFIDKTLIK